jgi:hypothetical protein
MTKYAIIGKKMNDQGTQIAEVEVREIKGTKVGFEPILWSREEVVSAIKGDQPIITLLRKEAPKWGRGEDIRVVSVNGTEYLRTDQKLDASDNLGNLPDF